MDQTISDMRKQNLANAVRRRVSSGWWVEASSDYQAIVVSTVTRRRHRPPSVRP